MTRITMSQIKSVRDAYHSRLGTDWRALGKDALIRHNGIVGQGIWFDRLRTGEYRPTLSVQVFVAPSDIGGTGAAVEFLSIKRRQVVLQSHDSMFESVLEGLRADSSFPVHEPIDTRKVAELVERTAAPNLAECYCLACLKAYLGDSKMFWRWVEAFGDTAGKIQQEDPDRRSFLTEVEEWLAEGVATESLESVARTEREKAKVVDVESVTGRPLVPWPAVLARAKSCGVWPFETVGERVSTGQETPQWLRCSCSVRSAILGGPTNSVRSPYSGSWKSCSSSCSGRSSITASGSRRPPPVAIAAALPEPQLWTSTS